MILEVCAGCLAVYGVVDRICRSKERLATLERDTTVASQLAQETAAEARRLEAENKQAERLEKYYSKDPGGRAELVYLASRLDKAGR